MHCVRASNTEAIILFVINEAKCLWLFFKYVTMMMLIISTHILNLYVVLIVHGL